MASLIITTFGFVSPLPAFVAFFASSGDVPFFFSSVSLSCFCSASFSSFFSLSSVFSSFPSGSCFFLSSSSSSVTGFSSAFSFFLSSDPAIMSIGLNDDYDDNGDR
jgi:hypothetical protein